MCVIHMYKCSEDTEKSLKEYSNFPGKKKWGEEGVITHLLPMDVFDCSLQLFCK